MTLEGLDLLIAIIGIAVTLLIGILSLMYSFANREEDRSKADQARLRREIINEVKAEVYRDLANWGAAGLPIGRPIDRLVETDLESSDAERDDVESPGAQSGNYG